MNAENKSSVLVIKDRGTGEKHTVGLYQCSNTVSDYYTTQNLNYAFDGFGK